jgi:hypothetical protein
MLDSQTRAMAIVCKYRICIGSIKKAVNKSIGFIRYIKGDISFISPGFHKDDPIDGTADELMNRFTFELRIPIRTNNDAEIIMLPEIFLDTADQDRGKGACNVINDKAYCEGRSVLSPRAATLGDNPIGWRWIKSAP